MHLALSRVCAGDQGLEPAASRPVNSPLLPFLPLLSRLGHISYPGRFLVLDSFPSENNAARVRGAPLRLGLERPFRLLPRQEEGGHCAILVTGVQRTNPLAPAPEDLDKTQLLRAS